MTQIFTDDGLALPITVIRVGPCLVTQIKNREKDGYDAIQIGYKNSKKNRIRKSELGHFQKAGVAPLIHLCEFRDVDLSQYQLGQKIRADLFNIGQFVNVSGKSIGKGYSGNQKRHKFKRGPMTHGSKNHRLPGSIGPGTTPGRVFPGKLMSGQLGAKRVTVSRLQILGIDLSQNILILKGNVPGKPGNLVKIKSSY